MYSWRDTIVHTGYTIRQTIEVIDKSSLQVALVVGDDGKLLGTVTDGDIRRAILHNLDLGEPVSRVMNTNPTIASPDVTREEILKTMKRLRFNHIPIVDKTGTLIRLEVVTDMLETDKRPNSVVIMAGGLGTRLAPLTDDCPKPMLRVGSKPILEIIMDNFISQGFERFYFSVNYLSERITSYFGDGGRWGVSIEYLHENKRLGTAGALQLLPERPEEPFFVMNGDLLTKVNFQSLLDFHTGHDSFATMCVREYDFQVPYGVVQVDSSQITAIIEKPVHRFFINAGVYCLNPDCLDYIPRDDFFDMPTLFEKLVQERRTVCSFPIREYWIDIGRMTDFERANVEFPEVFG